jgi:tetrapyrrole methylase family protein/MazG family protein
MGKENESRFFSKHLEIVRKLRGPEGCPWDKEQTPSSMRGYLIEEAYEAVEAIEDGDADHLREELGDVILLVTMIATMMEETDDFTVSEVLEELNAKLIRRHPHVFGDAQAESATEVLAQWNRIKTDIEGRGREESRLDGITKSLPSLERSFKLQKKAAKAGFDWKGAEGPLSKIHEEIEEIEEARRGGDGDSVEAEIGDLLFSVVNLARHLDIDPAIALGQTNRKFERRFRHVETRMAQEGIAMSPDRLDVMDAYWEESKSFDDKADT